MKKKIFSEKGFSLVEMIIVVALIGMLVAIVVLTWGNTVAQKNDTQRKSDLAVIQNALQKYYANTLAYPTSLTFGGTLSDGIQTYNIPKDPKPLWREYCYEPIIISGSTTYQKYTLYAKLERFPSGFVPPGGFSLPYLCSGNEDYNYLVTNPFVT